MRVGDLVIWVYDRSVGLCIVTQIENEAITWIKPVKGERREDRFAYEACGSLRVSRYNLCAVSVAPDGRFEEAA